MKSGMCNSIIYVMINNCVLSSDKRIKSVLLLKYFSLPISYVNSMQQIITFGLILIEIITRKQNCVNKIFFVNLCFCNMIDEFRLVSQSFMDHGITYMKHAEGYILD